MKVTEYGTPRPHIIVENFLPEKVVNEILKEAVSLDKVFVSGRYNVKKKGMPKYWEIWLDDEFKDRTKSKILSSLDKYMWSEKMRRVYNNSRYPIFHTLSLTTIDKTHLIRYRTGDYYTFHPDEIILPYGFCTMSYLFCSKKKMFSGGDFVIKYKKEKKIIPFKRNTLIVYPRILLHGVTPVTLQSPEPENNRYSIQMWND